MTVWETFLKWFAGNLDSEGFDLDDEDITKFPKDIHFRRWGNNFNETKILPLFIEKYVDPTQGLIDMCRTAFENRHYSSEYFNDNNKIADIFIKYGANLDDVLLSLFNDIKGKTAKIDSDSYEDIPEEEENVRCENIAHQVVFCTLFKSKRIMNISCPKFDEIWNKINPLNVLYFGTIPLENYVKYLSIFGWKTEDEVSLFEFEHTIKLQHDELTKEILNDYCIEDIGNLILAY